MTELSVGLVFVCKIKKLLQHGIIVEIEGADRDGFVHISELSKRWVRDVKDVAREGEKIVCKIVRIEGQSVELSAKRVTDNERRQILRTWSIENRIGRILEKTSPKDDAQLMSEIRKEYGSVYNLYNEMTKSGAAAFGKVKLNKQSTEALLDFVEKTKKKITLKTELTVQNFGEEGIEGIKKLLSYPYSDKEYFTIKYIKAPKYMLVVNAGDTKKTLTENKRIIEAMEKKSKELGIEFKYRELKE